MPTPFTPAAGGEDAVLRALESLDTLLYTLAHELRLCADLASAPADARQAITTRETLAVTFDAFASRLEQAHAEARAIEARIRASQAGQAPAKEAP